MTPWKFYCRLSPRPVTLNPWNDEARNALLAGTAEVASRGVYEVYKKLYSTAYCRILNGWAN